MIEILLGSNKNYRIIGCSEKLVDKVVWLINFKKKFIKKYLIDFYKLADIF